MDRKPAKIIKILMVNPMDRTYGSTHRFRNFLQRIVLDHGFVVEYIEPNSELPFALTFSQANSAWGFLRGTLRRIFYALTKPYDILFTQTMTPLTAPAILIARLRNKKVLLDWDDLSWMLQRGAFRRFLVRYCEHRLLCLADIIFVPNRYLAQYGLKHGARKVLYVSHGIDRILFDPRAHEAGYLRKKFLIPDGHLVLGYLASFTTGGVMDLDFVFSSLREILKNQPSVSFVVIGGGPLWSSFQSLARKENLPRTYFTGWLSQAEVARYLAGIDIGLIFMRENSANKYKTSLKVAEYLSMHKPVIGHLVGETSDNFSSFCILTDAEKESFVGQIEQAVLKRPIVEREKVDAFLNQHYNWEKSAALVKNAIYEIHERPSVESGIPG